MISSAFSESALCGGSAMKWLAMLVGVCVLLALLGATWFTTCTRVQQQVQTTAFVFTLAIVVWYAVETHRLRTETQKMAEAQVLSALSTIHTAVSGPRTAIVRGYLATDFDKDLLEAVRSALGDRYVYGTKVRVEVIRKECGSSPEALRKLYDPLTSVAGPPGGSSISALDAVEQALEAFDAIALPVLEHVKVAQTAAKAYCPVLARTAPHILPYVAVQQVLRGDPGYRSEYVELLTLLDIDLTPYHGGQDWKGAPYG